MKYASVVEAKIILDKNFQSKRFGFVTVEKKEDVENILNRKRFFIYGRRINVGPAIKRQAWSLFINFFSKFNGEILGKDLIVISKNFYNSLERLQLKA